MVGMELLDHDCPSLKAAKPIPDPAQSLRLEFRQMVQELASTAHDPSLLDYLRRMTEGLQERAHPYTDLAFVIGPHVGLNINFVKANEWEDVFQVERYSCEPEEGECRLLLGLHSFLAFSFRSV